MFIASAMLGFRAVQCKRGQKHVLLGRTNYFVVDSELLIEDETR